MARTYSETPEPRFVEAAKTILPDGQAAGTPVDLSAIAAPEAGKYLHAKTSGSKVVMEWAAVAEVPAAAAANKYLHTVQDGTSIGVEWADAPTELPTAPADASEKTYALQLVQGVLSWVEVTG